MPHRPIDSSERMWSIPGDEELATFEAKKNTVLVSHGRPPWYEEDGNRILDAFVVGIAGGSASGKTYVAQQIVRDLGAIPTVIILSQDSFYKKLSPENSELAFASKYDFDHPDAIDMNMFASCLSDLKACKQSNIPIYSFALHQRLKETKYLYGASVIITEGILALADPALRELYDLKVFVQCDSDLMLARRIERDVKERGRSVEGILEQYLRYVKPSYDNFVRPTASHADIIVPGSNNTVAIELISTHIRRQLQERSTRFRQRMAIPHLYKPLESGSALIREPITLDATNLVILEQTPQVKGIYTILRNKTTSKQDFVFFVDRLSTLLVERAMGLLPHSQSTVLTPTNESYAGQTLDTLGICGVSILRSGGALERGFRRVIRDAPIGSLLIQSDNKTSEPLLLHIMLPRMVKERHQAEKAFVFLLDAQIGTGAAAFMAIRILLDHGVQQEKIVFVTMLVAKPGGIAVLRKAFPDVKFVCGGVDEQLKESWLEFTDEAGIRKRRKAWITSPGMGMIGDRYYL